jgi:hypothetical protein
LLIDMKKKEDNLSAEFKMPTRQDQNTQILDSAVVAGSQGIGAESGRGE